MSVIDHGKEPTTARQTLVESTGSLFAPGPEVRPVVELIDGRRTNDDLQPQHWRNALKNGAGDVAIYFRLAADHEWWLAYDPTGEYSAEFDGPYLVWTIYSSGPWQLSALPPSILDVNIGELFPAGECQIRRPQVIRTADAPGFARYSDIRESHNRRSS